MEKVATAFRILDSVFSGVRMSDLIDRQEAINALDRTCDRVCQYSKKQRAVMCSSCPLGSAFDVLDELPSVERRGKWKRKGKWYVCSECGTEMPFTGVYDKSQRFCFNCGARMEGTE